MTSPRRRKFFAFLLAIILPVSFFIFFEIKKHHTGIRLKKLPVLSLTSIPEFTLFTQTGDTLTRDSLNEKIVIADFFFTRCRGICPVLSNQMQRVQQWMKKNKNLRSKYL